MRRYFMRKLHCRSGSVSAVALAAVMLVAYPHPPEARSNEAIDPTIATESSDSRKARTFFVRQTVGDDANDGLAPHNAWRTLAMLEGAMKAGDTVYVGPGLYREQVTLADSGTAERRITLVGDTTGEHTSDPPGVVMITGAEAVDEGIFVPQPRPGVYAAPSPDAQVKGVVEMDGSQYRYRNARETREHLREGMSGIDVVAILASSFFYDRESKVVYIHTSDGKPPATHEIELIRRNDGIATYGKHFVTVTGFTLRHMATAGINFNKGSSNCVAVDNTAYGAWQGIRVSNSTDVLVAGNTLFRNGNSGVYFLSESTRGSAIGNVTYENAKGVRWSSGSARGLAVNNVAYRNHEAGVAIEESDDVVLSGNVLVDNAISQLLVRKSRYVSEGNCLESRGREQLIAQIFYAKRYETLAAYQQATNQDRSSRDGCNAVLEGIDVRKQHADTMSYAARARKRLAEGG